MRQVAGDIPTRIMKIRKAEIAKTPLKELQYFFSSTTETVRLLAPKSERLQAAIDELDLMCDTLMSRFDTLKHTLVLCQCEATWLYHSPLASWNMLGHRDAFFLIA